MDRNNAPEHRYCDALLAVGASTGGTVALEELLSRLPIDAPGTVVVQHIPGRFSRPFTEKLNQSCSLNVKQASDGELIVRGTAYVAPGDQHLEVVTRNSQYYCRISDTEPVGRHKPSVDVLFKSVAKSVANNAVGVILTGMGSDGASGLLKIRQAGGATIAQDEKTSVVWGMPGSAVALGAADEILSLKHIAQRVETLFRIADSRAARVRQSP